MRIFIKNQTLSAPTLPRFVSDGELAVVTIRDRNSHLFLTEDSRFLLPAKEAKHGEDPMFAARSLYQWITGCRAVDVRQIFGKKMEERRATFFSFRYPRTFWSDSFIGFIQSRPHAWIDFDLLDRFEDFAVHMQPTDFVAVGPNNPDHRADVNEFGEPTYPNRR